MRWVCPVLVSVVFVFGIIDFVKQQTAIEVVEEPTVEVVTEEAETINRDSLRLKIKDLDIKQINADKHSFKPVKLTPKTEKELNTNN